MVEPEEPRCPAGWWTAVYAANLVLPLTVGVPMTTKSAGGLVGMLAALVVVWLVGVGGCYHLPRAAEAVAVGGMYVAMLQFLPCLHVAALGVGLFGWVGVTGESPLRAPGWRSELGAFAVTLLTALFLLLVAWVFGGGPRLLFAPPVARTADEADYIDPGPGADRPEQARDP